MRVLVFGCSGMLGNAMIKVLAAKEDWIIFGTLRSPNPALQAIAPNVKIISNIDALDCNHLISAFIESRPQVVINCVGLVKQLVTSEDPTQAIPINSWLPHTLAKLCDLAGARLIHISTDCVFSGMKGNYRESDFSDATDLYGRSKFLGEVHYPNAITLRTSIIGHELNSTHGLVNWFLSQTKIVKGYTNAIFSGLPTCELARVIRDLIILNSKLNGLYHVGSAPISKYDLLNLINHEYKKKLEILPEDQPKINRSLNTRLFQEATGYQAPSWSKLIAQMHAFQEANKIV